MRRQSRRSTHHRKQQQQLRPPRPVTVISESKQRRDRYSITTSSVSTAAASSSYNNVVTSHNATKPDRPTTPINSCRSGRRASADEAMYVGRANTAPASSRSRRRTQTAFSQSSGQGSIRTPLLHPLTKGGIGI